MTACRRPGPDVAVRSRDSAHRAAACRADRPRTEAARNRFRIFSIASAAVSSSTAATARIGSPWYTGSIGEPAFAPLAGLDDCAVVGEGIGRRGKIVRRENRPHAGHRQRRCASMRFTRACGSGLSSSLQNSMPSARKSSAYFALPVTFARDRQSHSSCRSACSGPY